MTKQSTNDRASNSQQSALIAKMHEAHDAGSEASSFFLQFQPQLNRIEN